MLATVRDYALGLLRDSGEAFEVGRRHAAFYLASAEQPEREHANLQAAMQWAMHAEPSLLERSVAQQLQVCVPQERPAGAIECPQMVLVNGCLEEFTPREREVIDLAVRGWSNRQIANQLVIYERTAEGHIHNILGKLQLESRSQLAAWGVRAGLVPTEGPLPTAAALRG